MNLNLIVILNKRSSRSEGSGRATRSVACLARFLIKAQLQTIPPLMRQLAADFLQRRPPRFFLRHCACTLSLIQVLAAVRTQPLAIFAARNLQRNGQQNLLAHHIVEQNSFTLIIADLGFRVGHRHLIAPGISTLRTIEQIKLALHILPNRFQTPRAAQFQAGCQSALDPYVLYYLVLAVMLFDQVRPSAALDRRNLAILRPQVNRARFELLRKLHGMKFQVSDLEKHRKPPRTVQLPPQARGSTPGRRKY